MTQQSLIFVNGPGLETLQSQQERRRVRSQLQRRAYLHKQAPQVSALPEARVVTTCVCPNGTILTRPIHVRPILPRDDGNARAQEDCVCSSCGGNIDRDRRSQYRIARLEWSDPGSGRHDPFADPQVSAMGSRYHELIDDGLTVVLPGLRRADDFIKRYYQEWIQRPGQCPAVYHAIFFCATHYTHAILGSEDNIDQKLLYHRGEALKALRESMSHPKGAYSEDDIYMSIILLALNDRSVSQHLYLCDTSPFSSPLDKIQWLNICGAQPLADEHWKIIQLLVRQHGGLCSLKRFGLPWILTYAALADAALALRRPTYPLLGPTGDKLTYQPLKPYNGADEVVHTTFGGFRTLSSLNLKESIVQTFLDLNNFSLGVKGFLTGEDQACDADIIGDNRSILQHRLLSLPDPSSSPQEIFENAPPVGSGHSVHWMAIYSATRLASLSYSIHVTFPIARSTQNRQDLASSLRDYISHSDIPSNNEETSQLLLWCIMVGGIMAENTSSRRWYIAQLAKYLILLNIHDLTRLKEIMHSFAWLDIACDRGAVAMWKEAGREAPNS